MEPRMKNLLGIAGAVLTSALWATAANAGCAKINGVYMCASWITGSEELNATITGLGNVKDDCAAGACPAVTASVFGAAPPAGQTPDYCKPALGLNGLWTQNDGCAIEGVLYCVNPARNASKAEGQPFSLQATLTASDLVDSTDCSRNGKCTKKVPVGDDQPLLDQLSAYCVNPNWHAVAFTATKFWGVSELDYVDSKGILQALDVLDSCAIASLPSKYVPGQSYDCTQLFP